MTFVCNVSYELFFSFPFKHEKTEIECNFGSEIVVIRDGLLYVEHDEALHGTWSLYKESEYDEDKMDMLCIPREDFIQ